MPRLDPGEAAMDGTDGELGRRLRVGAVEAEEEVKVVVAEAVEEAGVSAKGTCSKGMTDVMIAVTEGTLTVLPDLDGGESEEKDGAAVIGEEGREVKAGVEVEGVVFGGVVGEERGGGEGGVPSGRGGKRMWTSVGWRLPLLGLTRRDQVEKPVVFQADREREL